MRKQVKARVLQDPDSTFSTLIFGFYFVVGLAQMPANVCTFQISPKKTEISRADQAEIWLEIAIQIGVVVP